MLYEYAEAQSWTEGVQMSPSETNWPGEREPSRDDVEVANEIPGAAFFSEFKNCLLSDPEAVGDENLMNLDLNVRKSNTVVGSRLT